MTHRIEHGWDMRDVRTSMRHHRMVLVERLGSVDFYTVPRTRAPLSIINECTTDCGENVGGSATRATAPEVAASDDGSDGDGDPEPERRRKPRPRIATLPPAQLLRPKAACALLGIGRTKLWQLSERDPRFPRKVVLGPRCVGWRSDALHDYLRTLEREG